MKKDLLSIRDLNAHDVSDLMETALKIKADITAYYDIFRGRTAVLIFDKPSLRTRITFEVAMNQFGGRSIYMSGKEISLGKRETIADGGRNLSRWVDAVVVRTFGHDFVEEMGRNSTIPVINALTDLEHPCQALACLLTLREHLGDDLRGRKMVFVGDGNNVSHSLMLLAPLTGMDFVMCCPEGYDPAPEIVAEAERSAGEAGTVYTLERKPEQAVRGADLVYTDVWASMGQEEETEARAIAFHPYQVNERLMTAAGPQCLVSHCLPAHRGQEITSGVLDSPQSIAFDEAENRLHAQKAVLYRFIGK
ncbi:MAG: ornithine carbamoyltransferase [Candidatus Latescibacterota bacterium]